MGYDSETAFSAALKRAVGQSPGAYRRQPGEAAEQVVTTSALSTAVREEASFA